MRFVFWRNHKILIRNLTFMILGIYLGMFLYLYFHGNQIDHLQYRNGQLGLALTECENSVDALEKEKKQRIQNQLIRSIRFSFDEKLDSLDETALLQELVNETHFLIGKKLEDVGKNPEFLYKLLHGKVITTKEKKFEIKVKTIYIQSNIDVWISAKEQKIN